MTTSVKGWRQALWAAALGWSAALATAAPLNISVGVNDASQRQAFTALVDEFKAANQDVDVHLTVTEIGAYRKALPGHLEADAPDVFNWFAGDQMRSFAQRGLLEDLSDLWKANTWANTFSNTQAAATWNDKPWGLPYQYYPQGLFFRKDVLAKVGITQPPRDLSAMLTACAKLNKAGVVPIALAGKDGSALAAWFDYIDLRTNGGEKHARLTEGKVPFNDPDVVRAFMMWRQLIDAKCFAPNALATDSGTAQGLLYQGRAGMMLLGTTASASFPEAVRGEIDYARFPMIDLGQPYAEAAPTDNFHIAAKAKNKADARRFLKFAATSAANAKLAKALGSFPTNKFAPVAGTVLDLNSYKVLTEAKGGLVQAYEREAPAEMAQQGIKGLQDFMAAPQKIYEVLGRLEAVRQTAYHANLPTEPTAAGRKK